MGRKNAHGLPSYLRLKSDGTYILDHPVPLTGKGPRKRKIEVLGKIPKALAIEIRDKRVYELKYGRYREKRISFSEAADGFLAHSKSRKRSWGKDVQLVRELNAFFGEVLLEDLSVDLVEGFINKIRKKGPKGKPLKPSSVNGYLACLKTIVNRALKNDLIDRNPIRGLELLKVNNARDRVLTWVEFQRLLDCCTDYLRPMVALAFFTGMRRGEILGLRWNQLFLKEKAIRLLAEDTKTDSAREVPLDDFLVGELRKVERIVGVDQVFTWRRKPVRSIKTAFRRACREAEIKDFRFHDLRHCAVTYLRKAGVPSNVIKSISGHKTDHMLHRYDRVDAEDRLEALGKIRKLYESRGTSELKSA